MKKLLLSFFASFIFATGFSQVTTTLDGSGSTDADGTISAYQWRQISGATVVIVNPTTVKPTVTFTVAGIYTFGLVVTDNQGAKSAEDTMQVTVRSANIAPHANAGADQIIQLGGVTSMAVKKESLYVENLYFGNIAFSY